jgi:hypothetical protein
MNIEVFGTFILNGSFSFLGYFLSIKHKILNEKMPNFLCIKEIKNFFQILININLFELSLCYNGDD